MNRIALPIDPFLNDLSQELEKAKCLVLEAAPGSGKTTRVPPALLKAAFRGDREILVLEPRRLAAKLAARRVADELGEQVGETVGYHFRFENVGGPRTRIRFLTEGMFIRRLLSDPLLGNVAAVIVDEFHERHLQGDIALGALKRLQQNSRSDLRVVVMSATLDSAAVARYLGDCRVMKVDGRLYEIAVEYRADDGRYLDAQIESAVRQVIATAFEGDILVFLPGQAEIRRAGDALAELARRENLLVVPLFGDLSKEEQDRAVQPASKRKVILSTNVAETSLTILGVSVVIDSGLARQASFSYWSGLPALRTRAISRASAIQRAGRAGRTQAGLCVRLYTKQSFETRPAFETPEVTRADLSQTVLELKALGVDDVTTFSWFEPPQASSLEAAVKLLYRLGALDASGHLTELGRRMSEMPAHPRLARLVLEGERLSVAHEACTLAALLSEGRPGDGGQTDLLAQLEHYHPDFSGKRARDQLLRHLKKTTPLKDKAETERALARCILAAFSDRVAKKRELASNVARNFSGNKCELVLSSGGAALLEETRVVGTHEYFIAVDLEERSHQSGQPATRVLRSVCAIEPEWLFDVTPIGVVEKTETRWDAARERVEAVTRILYDGLVLDESAASTDDAAIAAIADRLATAALAAGLGKFCEQADLQSLINRVKFVRDTLPDPTFPEIDDAAIKSALVELCQGRKSFAELRQANVLEAITGLLSSEQRAKLERLAPNEVTLHAGKRVRVHYETGKAPWIESRLQDFFGMKTGPALLAGRVPLTLHLLAPNMRAEQVTSDLPGFWSRVYPELRRELGRRYPRHKWPENPLEIPPGGTGPTRRQR